jgi:adenylate cyclase class IV
VIEVEKKFILSAGDEQKLTTGATFVKEVEMADVYYDTGENALTRKDTWFRERNGSWELKVPMNTGPSGERVADQYRELTDDAEIAGKLGLDPSLPLRDELAKHGYGIVAPLVTKRRKYTRDGFTIDIDSIDFGYEIAEIEALVEAEDQIEPAVQRIIAFATSLGLATAPVRGKVLEYIRRKRPEHYQQLLDSRVTTI